MRIAGVYSFNHGKEFIAGRYAELLTEVNAVIKAVDSTQLKTKISAEKTMTGRKLYSPRPSMSRLVKSFQHGTGAKFVSAATIPQHFTNLITKHVQSSLAPFERWISSKKTRHRSSIR